MSRTYKVKIDVDPVQNEEATTLTKRVLEDKLGMEIDDHLVHDNHTATFWGHVDLAGGKTPDDAHEYLLEKLREVRVPELRVVTHWLDLDALEWDEVIGNDPEDQ